SRRPDTPQCGCDSPSPCSRETFAGSTRRPRLDSPPPRTSPVPGGSWDRRASTEWRRSSGRYLGSLRPLRPTPESRPCLDLERRIALLLLSSRLLFLILLS